MRQLEQTISQLLDYLQRQKSLESVEFQGDTSMLTRCISGLSVLDKACESDVCCVFNPSLFPQVSDSKLGLLITSNKAPDFEVPSIRVNDPYLAYALISQCFSPQLSTNQGIHPTAQIAETAIVHDDVSIGAFAVVEGGVEIGSGAVIGAHTYIGEDCHIGEKTILHPRVSIYHGVSLGQRCEVHSGTVIGADGFGFAPLGHAQSETSSSWVKIAQLGGVQIGDDVNVGANTTIDRGAIENTIIGNGVIIDNQVQIAHNVIIGDNTAIAGCTGIAGSSIIGKNCRLAGGVGLAGHLEIADNVVITGMSMVTKSIKEAGSYSCGTPLQETKTWRKNAARFAQLDKTLRKIRN